MSFHGSRRAGARRRLPDMGLTPDTVAGGASVEYLAELRATALKRAERAEQDGQFVLQVGFFGTLTDVVPAVPGEPVNGQYVEPVVEARWEQIERTPLASPVLPQVQPRDFPTLG